MHTHIERMVLVEEIVEKCFMMLSKWNMMQMKWEHSKWGESFLRYSMYHAFIHDEYC